MTDEQRRALEFEEGYAKRSGVPRIWLRMQGRIVATCHCGEADCKGFKSISLEEYNDTRELYRADVQVLPNLAEGLI